jgi:uncharacterized membrane protein
MKNIILLFVLTVGFTHCKENPKQDNGQTAGTGVQSNEKLEGTVQIKGLLMQSFGKNGFLDYRQNTMYEITDQTNMLDTAYARAVAPCHYMSESVYAVLTGKFTRTGSTGFKVFDIMRIDSMVAKTPDNVRSTGVPFEFWCFGSDPDWDIEISHYEGGVFYQNASENAAWFCPWIPPAIKGDTWTYDIPAGSSTIVTGAMTIKIKKESFTDAKTGKVYDYSVELKVNGKTHKGGAIKGVGKVLGPEGKE